MTWRSRAACLGMDSAIFFPEIGATPGHATDTEPARKICATCAVNVECLEDALSESIAKDAAGIRGGFTAQERKAMRWKKWRRRRLESA